MFKHGKAICYSGYRVGQDPGLGIYPSFNEVKEDLELLSGHWQYLRMYDAGPHAETTLQVIKQEGFDFKLMLGVDHAAEMSNPDCPWGAEFSDEQLAENQLSNRQQVDRVIELANAYPEIVFAVSAGNESTVDWNDHMVPVDNVIAYASRIKSSIPQPVTFCENYVPWLDKLEPLVDVIDFISVHTYPVWEYKTIDDALAYTIENYNSVKSRYPHKTVIITEAGWTTGSNGRGIEPSNANEDLQAQYCEQLLTWATEEGILTFVFEAFDEPWKGSADPFEPEKHWGLYFVDRTPKKVVRTHRA